MTYFPDNLSMCGNKGNNVQSGPAAALPALMKYAHLVTLAMVFPKAR
jgi:hypothetical protein